MKWFFIIVGGMFVGGILCLVVLWFGIKFLIKRLVKKLVTALEKLGGQGVPPFRITLQKTNQLEFKDAKLVDAATDALKSIGYTLIGDFRSKEMPTVKLRALSNSAENTYAVLSEVGDMGPLLDIACDFKDGDHVTVSTAPETGLDRPDFSRLIRVETDLAADPATAVATLHERMVAEHNGRPAVAATADAFPNAFCLAHAREMDWRIARGGVTAEEVRRNCEVVGTEPPTDDAVQVVINSWRLAISAFVDEQLRERFLKHVTQMSAAEWEGVRERLYFVHEHSDRDSVIEELAGRLSDADGHGAADDNGEDDDDDDAGPGTEAVYERLRPLFAGAPIREAFLTAQDLLPPEQRYKLVAGIKNPYGADVYVEPAWADSDDEDA